MKPRKPHYLIVFIIIGTALVSYLTRNNLSATPTQSKLSSDHQTSSTVKNNNIHKTTHELVNTMLSTSERVHNSLASPYKTLELHDRTPIKPQSLPIKSTSKVSKLGLATNQEFGNIGSLEANYNPAKNQNKEPDKITQTYIDLITLNKNNSSFTCPPNLPYAISYNLTNSEKTQTPTVMAQSYANSCSKGAGGTAFGDLLFGLDQHPHDFGKADQLTAFIPKTTPEGCTVGPWSDVLIPISFAATTEVKPQTNYINGQKVVVGFTQNTNNQVNCNKVCNSLIATYCLHDPSMGHCSQLVLAAYKVKSIYLARNIHENFCACSLASPDWGEKWLEWAYTNAVDIENATTYNNPLKSITCSNTPN